MIIDTHCHILREDYDNIEEIMDVLEKEHIIVILSGYDLESSNESLELAKKYKNAYCTIGIHPLNSNNITDKHIAELEKLLEDEKVVGIGEIGLDYHYPETNKQNQKEIFIKQLKLAQKHNKPVVIHSRDSIQDIYNILKKYNLKGILHAFSGSFEMAKEFLKIGYKIGIGGVVTFKNSKLSETLRKLELENLVVETDSPYLTPDPYRGKKNNPLYSKLVVKKIAEIYGVSIEEVQRITTLNASALFDLKLLR